MILYGDCAEVLNIVDENSIDLIVTSPPYANARGKGIHPDRYVSWFGSKMFEFKRVLKPTGTLILNIKERVIDGERQTYVFDLIKAMRSHGWLWTEEFIWHKKNSYPGKWPNRFRDAWERCLQFNLQRKFNMYQDEVMVPIGDWAEKRLQNLSKTDMVRDESKVGSGFGKNVSNWNGRNLVYPTNVLHLATETGNNGHHSAFPYELPVWFIKLFTLPGDMVLDPFCGSGTSLLAAKDLGRKWMGVELNRKFYKLAENRLA